jgi:hypothetical protein
MKLQAEKARHYEAEAPMRECKARIRSAAASGKESTTCLVLTDAHRQALLKDRFTIDIDRGITTVGWSNPDVYMK